MTASTRLKTNTAPIEIDRRGLPPFDGSGLTVAEFGAKGLARLRLEKSTVVRYTPLSTWMEGVAALAVDLLAGRVVGEAEVDLPGLGVAVLRRSARGVKVFLHLEGAYVEGEFTAGELGAQVGLGRGDHVGWNDPVHGPCHGTIAMVHVPRGVCDVFLDVDSPGGSDTLRTVAHDLLRRIP